MKSSLNERQQSAARTAAQIGNDTSLGWRGQEIMEDLGVEFEQPVMRKIIVVVGGDGNRMKVVPFSAGHTVR